MTRLHLIDKATKALIGRPFNEGGRIPHPDKPMGALGSPAKAGWENETYAVVAFKAAPVPSEGMQRDGSAMRTFDAKTGNVIETFKEVAKPEVVERTVAEKIQSLAENAGLTVAELKEGLGISQSATRL